MISVTNKSHKGDISQSGKQSTFRNKNSAIVVIRVILVEIIQKKTMSMVLMDSEEDIH